MTEKPINSFNTMWWESAKSARAAQIDYGRWIVNTLWLMHSGAIAGLLSKWNGSGPLPQSTSLALFVAGIVFAFATASLAWLNFSVAEDWFKRWAYEGDDWSKTNMEQHSVWLKRTMYAAVASVVASIVCLVLGAALILRTA